MIRGSRQAGWVGAVKRTTLSQKTGRCVCREDKCVEAGGTTHSR